jgi:DNA-binding NtrC family response regulator
MKQKRLLIIDDEVDIRDYLASRAESIGITTTTASNGQDALKLFETEEFEAVLSDIKMPKMSGIDLLRALRSAGHQLPFIILTGFGDKDTVVEALKLGAFDFIEKPCDDENLFAVLNAAIELGAELNYWRHESSVTESLLKMGAENGAQAAAEIERLFALVKGGKRYHK